MQVVNIQLERDEAGQIVDGLKVLAEQWEATADYLESGRVREDVAIRECHSAHEARNMMQIYDSIIARIRQQLPTPSVE
jgi:hypothetical protein